MPRSAPQGRSATRRRTRGALSRESILAAGLRLAREDDLRRLTMERLGRELGVSGMALYRHFRDKRALIDGVLDHFVRDAAVTAHGVDSADWRRWMRATFRAMYRALADTPGVLPFVASQTSWRFGPAAMAVLDETLGVLADAGFARREAAEIYTTALALSVGWATITSNAQGFEDDPEDPRGAHSAAEGAEQRRRLALRFADASRAAQPHVVGSARELASVSMSDRLFERALGRCLDAYSGGSR